MASYQGDDTTGFKARLTITLSRLSSRRVFDILSEMVLQVEPYSIDEMFLDLFGLNVDRIALSGEIRARVLRATKVPTCVGIGETKTIAKVANKLAKADRSGCGTLDLSSPEAKSAFYPTADINDVWGWGGRPRPSFPSWA